MKFPNAVANDAGFVTVLFLALLLGATSLFFGFAVTADLVQTRLRAAQTADAIALAVWRGDELENDSCAAIATRLLESGQHLTSCELAETSLVRVEARPRLAITAKLFPEIQVTARAGLEFGDQIIE